MLYTSKIVFFLKKLSHDKKYHDLKIKYRLGI